MTHATQSPNAYSEPWQTSEPPVVVDGMQPQTESVETESFAPKCQVYLLDEHTRTTAVTPSKHTPIHELIAEWEQDGSRRVAMEEARRWAATTLHDDACDTVRTLRLRKGWSQARLAEEMGTSQSHVARIERGTENVLIDTCRRLAMALAIDMNTLDQALRLQESFAQGKTAQ